MKNKDAASGRFGFQNSNLNGQPKQKKRRVVRRTAKAAGVSTDVRFNSERSYCCAEPIVKREERELSVAEDEGEQLSYALDFRRFNTKRHGGLFLSKVYQSGTFVTVTRVRAVHIHDWHCPTTIIYWDTVKLCRGRSRNTYQIHLPRDRL